MSALLDCSACTLAVGYMHCRPLGYPRCLYVRAMPVAASLLLRLRLRLRPLRHKASAFSLVLLRFVRASP